MAYTTIDNPELYMQCKNYTGTGSAASITLDGDENMSPDLVWTKKRSNTGGHIINDSVRGSGKHLFANLNNAEATYAQFLTSFDTDGFAVGNDAEINQSSQTYTAWCWKAGGSASTNDTGSIDSSVSANTTAGFSVLTWTANNTAGATVGHGLSSAPKMVIVKNRTSTYNWTIHHQKLTDASYVLIFTTAAQSASTAQFNDTAPSSSVITLGAEGNTNSASGNSMVAYAFSEVQGYSKFGSYTGNGSTTLNFVHLGFKPAWLMIKNTAATQPWLVFNNKSFPFNGPVRYSHPNTNAAEGGYDGSFTDYIDLLSNGFCLTDNSAYINSSGVKYIYAAFAEAPFVNSNGVPNNAR